MKKFNFDNLFVLDLANNHQGDLDHGIKIIDMLGDVVERTGSRAGLKFQFRQLKSFIHPDFKDNPDVKHIPRFIETELNKDQYKILTEKARQKGLLTICTPFDEESIPIILELGIDIIKVASCSAADWPLLDAVSKANRPIIVSTAGLNISKIDRLVSFLTNRGVDFALMHCVAIYPTPDNKLNLNQVSVLRNRYPEVTVGFSTHENQDNYNAVKIAYAKGAKIFERHVGLEANGHKLNLYSSNPSQVENWINACIEAREMCGGEERLPADQFETESLRTLVRGVYMNKAIKSGEKIRRDDVYFAMPIQEGQMGSGDWSEDLVADQNYDKDSPIAESLASLEVDDANRIFSILLQVKGLLNQARIYIGKESSIEISHHYGLERFREFGAVIVDCVNREYCKKLIVMLPRQKHPYHYHKTKEETFQLLSGDLEVERDGHKFKLEPGDTLLIGPKQWHKFHTLDGAVFEEVSTTHYNNDSFYDDESIARLPRENRKTKIPNWEVAERTAVGP